MSNLKQVSREFKTDFALWEIRLVEEGYDTPAIEEIKQDIRDAWDDNEGREFWIGYVKKEADFMRELQAMAAGITNRIKQSIKEKTA